MLLGGSMLIVIENNLELGPKFQKKHELGPDVFYRVHELSPDIFYQLHEMVLAH